MNKMMVLKFLPPRFSSQRDKYFLPNISVFDYAFYNNFFIIDDLNDSVLNEQNLVQEISPRKKFQIKGILTDKIFEDEINEIYKEYKGKGPEKQSKSKIQNLRDKEDNFEKYRESVDDKIR